MNRDKSLKIAGVACITSGLAIEVLAFVARHPIGLFVGSIFCTVGVGFLITALVLWNRQMKALFQSIKSPPASATTLRVIDEHGNPLPDNDPLARSVIRAYETGEPVFWNEGDPLP